MLSFLIESPEDDGNQSQLTSSSILDDNMPPTDDGVWHRRYYYANIDDLRKPWSINSYFVPIVVTYSVTFLIGAIGNIIIVITMTKEKTSRNATSMFLVSLAVADLLLLFICAPLETLHYFLVTWDHTPAMCQLGTYVKTLSAVSSVLNLTAVSFERYVVIVYPMKSRALCTMSNCRRALIIVWLVSFVLSMPVVIPKAPDPITYYNNFTNLTIYYCLDSEEEHEGLPLILSFYQLAIMFALPLLLMTFCYTRVIRELWKSTVVMSAMTKLNSSTRFDSRSSISSSLRNSTAVTPMTPSASATNSLLHRQSPTRLSAHCDDVRQARKQVIKMLILVIVLFLVCWGPYLVMNVLLKKGLKLYTTTWYSLRVAFTLLPFVHSCLNPIIYSFMSSNFRRMMVRTCSPHAPCCQKGIGGGGGGGARFRYYQRATSTSGSGGVNGDAATRRGHARLHHTCSNTCSSDVRTSPITECESMLHDALSIA